MKKINILFMTCSLDVGGTERHIYQIISNLDKKRFKSVVCCLYDPGSFGNTLIKNRVRVYHNLIKKKTDLLCCWKLAEIYREENIQIIYIVNFPITIFWGVICGILSGNRLFLTRITTTRSSTTPDVLRWRILNRLLLPFVRKIVVQADLHKDYVVKKEGMRAERVKVIYNGVDLERFQYVADNNSLKKILNIPDKVPVVGIVARLSSEKGHKVFLKAARKINEQIPSAHFIFVGDGDDSEFLKQMASDFSIQSKTHFTGVITNISKMVSLFDVAVLCSIAKETFSNAILEYMALSKPVVATDLGSIPEQVIDGKTGFLISPGDHDALAERIIRLLNDPELADNMGGAGRELVEKKFSVKKMVDQYDSLFTELMK